MDAWIEIRSRLKRDPKLKRFYRKLDIIQPTALGMLVDLWLYCFEQQNDGVLTHIDRRDIAAEMFWPEDRADDLWAALTEVGPVTPRYPSGEPGFVDPDGRVHKWGEFRLHWSSLNMKQDAKRDKTRNRVKKYRERNDFGNALRNGLVTLRNAPTSKTRKTSNKEQKELLLSGDSPAPEEDLGMMVERLSDDFDRFWEAYPRKVGDFTAGPASLSFIISFFGSGTSAGTSGFLVPPSW